MDPRKPAVLEFVDMLPSEASRCRLPVSKVLEAWVALIAFFAAASLFS